MIEFHFGVRRPYYAKTGRYLIFAQYAIFHIFAKYLRRDLVLSVANMCKLWKNNRRLVLCIFQLFMICLFCAIYVYDEQHIRDHYFQKTISHIIYVNTNFGLLFLLKKKCFCNVNNIISIIFCKMIHLHVLNLGIPYFYETIIFTNSLFDRTRKLTYL